MLSAFSASWIDGVGEALALLGVLNAVTLEAADFAFNEGASPVGLELEKTTPVAETFEAGKDILLETVARDAELLLLLQGIGLQYIYEMHTAAAAEVQIAKFQHRRPRLLEANMASFR